MSFRVVRAPITLDSVQEQLIKAAGDYAEMNPDTDYLEALANFLKLAESAFIDGVRPR
jgi:hypothetical protein